ncbi:zinc ribbon domain-containing protein [Cupriavidus taiwanensis]|uniref:Zn-ribbon domain-containing OB-fold protein n=1 Tax=Cupriavidus taiwanensis TaxID=164546 RepID=UPI002540DADF|nr:zinc ribbon domain-containing protein [Cupriavidus taiwanensis]MDK3025969.1 zinc ribbon domain-containing protein [Cupriavidus taiwanensis]
MSAHSPAWQALAAATPPNGLALPHCAACGHRFYPPQRYCPRCLHGEIEHLPDSGAGVVLSVAVLHHTLEPRMARRLPLHVAAVRLDAGVDLFALADAMLPAGTRVTVWLDRDEHHPDGVLRARWPSLHAAGDHA